MNRTLRRPLSRPPNKGIPLWTIIVAVIIIVILTILLIIVWTALNNCIKEQLNDIPPVPLGS